MMDDIWVMENAGYVVEKGKPVILLFSRNYRKKFETITHRVHGFRPYFYCPATETNIGLPKNCEYDNEVIIDALGREVVKVYVDIPRRVADIRDNYSFTDMSDFLFEKRFLVDYKIKYAYTWDGKEPHPIDIDGILEPRILFYDIENLSMDGGFPDATDANYPTCMIQVKDSYTKKHVLITSGVPQTDFEGHIACKNEHAMLRVFKECVETFNPDIITGWYTSAYDLPYLLKRSENICSNVNFIARYNRPFRRFDPKKNVWSCKSPGRSILDMRAAFEKKTAVEAERESYALKSIAASYGFEYNDYGPTIGKLFENKDWKTLLQYGLNDVIALELINEKASLFTFFESLRKFTGCFLDDVLHTSLPIELLLMHRGIKPMPRKMPFVDEGKKYQGAIVHENPVGIHHNVMTIDIAALYPNILFGFSLSPDVDGLVSLALKEIMDERERLRSLRKEDPENMVLYYEEQAIKVIANAFYGNIGSKSFRIYNESVASKITEWGRNINLMLKKEAESLCLLAVGGDSVGKDTIIQLYDMYYNSYYSISMNVLFKLSENRKIVNGKEYGDLKYLLVKTVDDNKKIVYRPIKYIVRHKVNKNIYKVFTKKDSIIVTEDHSLIDINLHCIKPTCAKYVVKEDKKGSITKKRSGCERVFDYDDYVYDIEVDEYHRFFANDILVHNTDSLFLKEVQSVDEGLQYEKHFNDFLEKFSLENNSKVIFKLKFEKYFKTLLFKYNKKGDKAAKKNYIGHLVWEEGKEKSEQYDKGTELTRSDNSRITKEILKTFIDFVVMKDDLEGGKKYIKEMYDKIKKGDIPIYEVSIPKEVRTVAKTGRKASPWQCGKDNTAKYLKQYIGEGTKPRLIYLITEPRVFCIDEDTDIGDWINYIDWPETLEKTVTSKLRSYVEATGLNWDTVVHGQCSLDAWF